MLPLALMAVAALLVLSWRDELPERIATHWGTDGPDGFSSFAGAFVPLLIGVAVCTGQWAFAFWRGHDGVTRRGLIATSAGLGALFAVVETGTLASQRGLADGALAPGETSTVVLGLVVAVVVAGLAFLLAPADPPMPAQGPVDADARRVPLSRSQRAAWSRTVGSPTALVPAGAAVAMTTVLAVVLDEWAALLIPFGLAVLLAATLLWRVTVDSRGLEARSVVGWPRVRVPVDEVERADVVQVQPLRQFGGWGYRLGRDGRSGLVLRAGEAIEVRRTGSRVLVVTVDDAATAAALLNTLADHRRA
ncbi:DUF1648 domain-containing protein [Cellulomonas palmilytica]|uniref:DUF1648 domain-containing protein n=1 Tax=Cellulomonas palmilytica TaxID=2608402 RepID=UPI001F255927|nr:DUF1648 domain-containing protein [Cellulomonas palmilytica]UJP38615.1 DUF1648 domain-containing protein [Cellulomonas palmilytica]